jgi:uncharacterized surface protein with fasciclin (FAS1) repeats
LTGVTHASWVLFAALLPAPAAWAQQPQTPAEQPPQGGGAQAAPGGEAADVLGAMTRAGRYQSFLKVLETTGLSKTLHGPGPYTVFAPTDEAFKKVHPEMLQLLYKTEGKLKELAAYHVVQGKMTADEIAKLSELKTLQGSVVKVSTNDGLRLNFGKVIQPVIAASNGVVLPIDMILIPTASKYVPPPKGAAQTPPAGGAKAKPPAPSGGAQTQRKKRRP